MMKGLKKICSFMAICLFALFTLAGCGDRAISDLEIKAGTFAYTYEKGEEYSLEDLVVIVKWNDATEEEVEYGNENLSVTGFATDKVEKKEVTITYMEKSITIEISVVAPYLSTQARNKIASIPSVDDLTLEDAQLVQDARTLYNFVPVDEQSKVTNLAVLEAAEVKMAELQAAKSLNDYKVSRKAYLASYKAQTNYNAANWETIQGYINVANTAIDAATTNAEIDNAVNAAKTQIDAIKVKLVTDVEEAIAALPTVDDLNKEDSANVSAARNAYNALSADHKAQVTNLETLEAAEAKISSLLSLEEFKTQKKEQLANAYNENNYNEANWETIQGYITAANTAIDAATTNADITTIVNNAFDQINAIKTKNITDIEEAIEDLPAAAQITTTASLNTVKEIRNAYNDLDATSRAQVSNIAKLEEVEAALLAVYKTELKAELAAYKDEDNYSPTGWARIQEYIVAGNNSIDAANSFEAVDAMLENAKANLDTVLDGSSETVGNTVVAWFVPDSETLRRANIANAEENAKYLNADADKTYLVGDDNAFYYVPIIGVEDKDGNETTGLTQYKSVTEVYIKENGDYRKLEDDELSTYFDDINSYTFGYDFSENAINKEFKLVITPYGNHDDVSPLEKEFKVIDGYNVHNAKELGVINTNTHKNDDDAVIPASEYYSAWLTFLKNNKVTIPQGGTDSINAVILHNNMEIKLSDIPSMYIKEGGYLVDYSDIYARTVNGTFALHGNFYNIDATRLPLINVAEAKNGYSHASLFRLTSRCDGQWENTTGCTQEEINNTSFTFENTSIIGNANKDVNNEGFGGLIMLKANKLVSNFNNALVRTFYINIYGENYYTADYKLVGKVNLNYVGSYDAFQNLLFSWGGMDYDIKNSELKKSGGPAMIMQHVDISDKYYADGRYPTVTVDENTVIESYVTGNENWFIKVNGQPIATNISAMNNYFLGLSSGDNGIPNTGYVSQTAGENNKKMNMMTIFMTDGPGPAAFKGDPGTQGFLTVAGEKVVDFGDIRAEEMAALYAAYNKGAPIFISDTGAIAYIGGSGFEVLNNGKQAGFTNAEYVTVYLMGMAVVLEFNID